MVMRRYDPNRTESYGWFNAARWHPCYHYGKTGIVPVIGVCSDAPMCRMTYRLPVLARVVS